MTVIVRRSDCECGGISGLFFGRIEISRVTAPEESPDGRPGYVTEIHYPPGALITCMFYLNSRPISPTAMIVNNGRARLQCAAKVAGP